MPQSTGRLVRDQCGGAAAHSPRCTPTRSPSTPWSSGSGIASYARTPYRRLSGGQQQAVNLAGALVGRPELVFLDEPTAGLDPHARRASWDLVRELRARRRRRRADHARHGRGRRAGRPGRRSSIAAGCARRGTVAELTADGASLEDVFLRHTHAEAVR